MGLLLALVYIGLIAALTYWLLGRSWPRPRKLAVLALVLLALPVGGLISLIGDSREAVGWGIGLLLVTVVPANLIGLAIGGLLAWRRASRA
ncbi:MAG: hypothetical protein WA842_02305 [Croceibacterium sp.]